MLLPLLVNSIGHAHFAQGGFEAAEEVAALMRHLLKRKKLGMNPSVALLDKKGCI
jgi:hypothetical protein